MGSALDPWPQLPASGGDKVEKLRKETVSRLHAAPSPAPQVIAETPRNKPYVLESRTVVFNVSQRNMVQAQG